MNKFKNRCYKVSCSKNTYTINISDVDNTLTKEKFAIIIMKMYYCSKQLCLQKYEKLKGGSPYNKRTHLHILC